jgi:hypothetical protein
MKKILQPVNVLCKSLTIVFLMSFSILSARAQNMAANFSASEAGVTNIANDNASLSVYPNPAADEAILVFNSSGYDVRYQVRIINNEGIQLRNIEGTTMQGRNTIRIHVGDYPPGVYYIQLLTSTGKQIVKLLKQPLNSF